MKVNYMKMIMAKGVFKMRAAEGRQPEPCVCMCASLFKAPAPVRQS